MNKFLLINGDNGKTIFNLNNIYEMTVMNDGTVQLITLDKGLIKFRINTLDIDNITYFLKDKNRELLELDGVE
ncbi:hypothetical protein [Brachyspira pilosicoli]|uniref:hypothetical protein n=1 Tax=Brachyspira pilosicoli TaxID=52584 RepID=UPI001CA54B80|nr:hypothetical protein [Brachyspira pilosicoli]MBW5391385.1 hypothetical protein [Brachyspira pilosicoli]